MLDLHGKQGDAFCLLISYKRGKILHQAAADISPPGYEFLAPASPATMPVGHSKNIQQGLGNQFLDNKCGSPMVGISIQKVVVMYMVDWWVCLMVQ